MDARKTHQMDARKQVSEKDQMTDSLCFIFCQERSANISVDHTSHALCLFRLIYVKVECEEDSKKIRRDAKKLRKKQLIMNVGVENVVVKKVSLGWSDFELGSFSSSLHKPPVKSHQTRIQMKIFDKEERRKIIILYLLLLHFLQQKILETDDFQVAF